ncbi:unnamed protein product [Caenorhabditis auriculariae]|uniref:TOG domain-containing protein n=1 Tax=Caenorhabditis auriculariae TaxID=2777116 RepID=A0A8S1HI27_9PELO|nr:unnamed protein product [Caenorhabditis auriculariae]
MNFKKSKFRPFQIEQYEKQAREEWEAENAEKAKARPAQTGATGDEAQEENGEETASGASQIVTSTAIDPWTLLDPVDVTANVPKTVETQLVDKNWKERLEGCETLKKAVDAVGRCEISERTREIAVVLVKIIEKDVNVNVASCAAEVLAGLAVKARFSFSPIAIRLFPVSFDKLKDKKQVLRDALNSLIDSAATTTTLTNYTEALSAALTGKNPQTRAQTAAFLARVIAKNDSTTMDIDGLKALIEAVSKAANDADKDVREETLRIVAATSKCVGDKIAQRLFSEIFEDKLKADRIPQMVEELEKTYGKIASEEMKRLAENSGVGGGPAPSKKPTSAAAPVKKAVPSAAVAPRPRPAPPAARPAPPKPAVAPFVARPAPPKPVVAAARSVQVRPKPAPTPVRTASSSSMKPLPRVAGLSSKPIVTPNVVQRPTSAPKPALSRPTSASRPAFVARPAPKFAAITSKINNVGTSISSSRPAPNVVKNSTLEGATQRASSAAATTRYNRPNVVTTTTTTTVKTMADDGIIKRQPLKIAPAPAGAAPTRSALPTGVRLPSARQHSLTKFDPQLKRSLSNLTGIPKPISRTPSQQKVGQPFPDLKLNKLKLSNGSLGPIE